MSALADDQYLLRLARCVAVAGLGLSAGVMATIPALTLPVLFSSSLSAEARLHTMMRLYDRVSAFMKPFVLSLSVLLGVCAVAANEPLMPAGWVEKNRKALLAAAALLNLAIAPYSMLFLSPLNRKLQGMERNVTKAKADGDHDAAAASAHEADILLARNYGKMYTVKVALGLAALVCAMAELGFA